MTGSGSAISSRLVTYYIERLKFASVCRPKLFFACIIEELEVELSWAFVKERAFKIKENDAFWGT